MKSAGPITFLMGLRPKVLATRVTALVAGVLAGFTFQSLETGPAGDSALGQSALFTYLGLFVLPFVIFVIGIDLQRWASKYQFSPEFKTDYRQIWIRFGFYVLGEIVFAVLT